MTRKECETIIASNLKAIRDTVHAYDPTITQVCIGVGEDFAWAFTLDKSAAEGETKYLLEITTHDGLHRKEESDVTA